EALEGVVINPPAAHRVPFLLAGRRPAALARAARLGDGGVGYLISPHGFAQARQTLIEERDRLGLAPATFVHSMLLPIRLDDHDAGARARASAAWSAVTSNGVTFPEHLFVAGSAAAVAEQLLAFVERGCEELVLSFIEEAGDLEAQID